MFQVTEGCWGIVEVIPLRPVNETFCLVPTDGANYEYLKSLKLWASVVQREPAKRRSNGGISVTSPMIKSVRDEEEEVESFSTVRIPLLRGKSSRFIGIDSPIFP